MAEGRHRLQGTSGQKEEQEQTCRRRGGPNRARALKEPSLEVGRVNDASLLKAGWMVRASLPCASLKPMTRLRAAPMPRLDT